jgi:hypothetical protein
MAKEKAIDDLETGLDLDAPQDVDIDQAVDGLRDVLKMDAGELPLAGGEDFDTMGGVQAFSSDFGSDFPETASGDSETFDGMAATGGDFAGATSAPAISAPISAAARPTSRLRRISARPRPPSRRWAGRARA